MTGMAIDSRHIWIGISRPQQEVYAFVADRPISQLASGLSDR